MPRKKGFFITFEGTEGAGKSTLIRAVRDRLEAAGVPSVVTREPGGTRLAEAMRELILKNPMHPVTELFLYEAARREHLAQVIQPSLDKGLIVLCDRFTDSSLAYQGAGRGIAWTTVKALNRVATDGLKPDLSVLLDVDPARGLKRATDRNRFEDEGVRFLERARRGFLRAVREDRKRWVVLKPTAKTKVDALAIQVLNSMVKACRVKV